MKKNNITSNNRINSRGKSFVKPIFTFFVVAIPSLLLWIFFSNDFPFAKEYKLEFPWWIKLFIGIALLISTTLITLLFIYIKILDWNIFNFSLPVAICFSVIFVTDNLEGWIRALIVLPFLFSIIPIFMIVKKIEMKEQIKRNKKTNNKEKVIGHK